MSRTYNIFISHSWSYGEQYEGLKKLLDADPYFKYADYSVPKDDPINDVGTDKELKEAITEQMKHASVVLILAGVYSTYSKWINKEIEIAKNGFEVPKKIIAVEYWGSEKTSTKVKENADKIVKWNSDSVIKAIKELVNSEV